MLLVRLVHSRRPGLLVGETVDVDAAAIARAPASYWCNDAVATDRDSRPHGIRRPHPSAASDEETSDGEIITGVWVQVGGK